MSAIFAVGDVFDRLAEVPDRSVDLIVTSPPYLALRSYLPADHPDKDREIGSERTPADFLDVMLRLTAEWRRVLAPHGSIAVELGDTYAGSGGAGGDYATNGLRGGQPKFGGSGRLSTYSDNRGNPDGMRDTTFQGANTRTGGGNGWPLAKSLTMIPELYRVGLAYGVNPLTGEESPAGMWRVRNLVDVVRPNPPVGALGDKFRPATSDLVVATIASDRYFDLDAVREPSEHTERPRRRQSEPAMTRGGTMGRGGNWGAFPNVESTHPAGAPPLDWWEITGSGYRGAHYAVWPPELLTRPIKSMCPEKVCRTCGKPSRRIVEIDKTGVPTRTITPATEARGAGRVDGTVSPHGRAQAPLERAGERTHVSASVTVGWTDCGHDDWRPGVVLDPFAGSGTTLMVATGHGRDAIGFDLDERNADLALERVGPLMLTVVEKGSPLP